MEDSLISIYTGVSSKGVEISVASSDFMNVGFNDQNSTAYDCLWLRITFEVSNLDSCS